MYYNCEQTWRASNQVRFGLGLVVCGNGRQARFLLLLRSPNPPLHLCLHCPESSDIRCGPKPHWRLAGANLNFGWLHQAFHDPCLERSATDTEFLGRFDCRVRFRTHERFIRKALTSVKLYFRLLAWRPRKSRRSFRIRFRFTALKASRAAACSRAIQLMRWIRTR